MIYLQLAIEFFQIGLFAIGGGLATLPFLERLSARSGWFSLQDLANMIAISESTPGPIGINMATYTGFHVAGVPGALVSTLSIITPATILVLIVARFLQRFADSRLVKAAFYGLRPASLGLILAAALSVLYVSLLDRAAFLQAYDWARLFNWKSIALALALFMGMKKWRFHPAIWIGISALMGVVFSF